MLDVSATLATPFSWPSAMSVMSLLGSVVLIGKIWALMYALVVLCIALGVVVVGRPSKRKVMKDKD